MTTPYDPNSSGQGPLVPPPAGAGQAQWGAPAQQQAYSPQGGAGQFGQPPADQGGAPSHGAANPQVPTWNQAGAQIPSTAYYQSPTPKRKRGPLIVRLVILGVVAAIAIGGYLVSKKNSASVDSNGNVTKAGSLDVFSLTTGQCFDKPGDSASTVSSIKAIPCDQPHSAQVIGSYTLTDSTYDSTAVDKEASDACTKIGSGPTVDASKLSSNADIFDFQPTSDSWNHNDRSVTCAVDNGAGTTLTGSVLK